MLNTFRFVLLKRNISFGNFLFLKVRPPGTLLEDSNLTMPAVEDIFPMQSVSCQSHPHPLIDACGGSFLEGRGYCYRCRPLVSSTIADRFFGVTVNGVREARARARHALPHHARAFRSDHLVPWTFDEEPTMKRMLLYSLVFITVTATHLDAQSRATNTFTVRDNSGNTQVLTLGLDPSATDGIDAVLGEVERPAIPPSGTFDVRFVGDDIGVALHRGTSVDYRQGSTITTRTCIHEVKFQLKSGTSSITIEWNILHGGLVRLQDMITGSLLDLTLSGTGSNTLGSAYGLKKLKLTAAYNADAMPVELSTFTADVIGTHVVLHWTTASETNNLGFDIERCDDAGRTVNETWKKIGYVEGSGTSAVPKDYRFMDLSPGGATTVSYRLKQIDRDGACHYSSVVDAALAMPAAFMLEQNYPNPFNPSTVIAFTLGADGRTTLKVYDMLGRCIAVLVEADLKAGVRYRIPFTASSLPSGPYWCRLVSGGHTAARMLTVVK